MACRRGHARGVARSIFARRLSTIFDTAAHHAFHLGKAHRGHAPCASPPADRIRAVMRHIELFKNISSASGGREGSGPKSFHRPRESGDPCFRRRASAAKANLAEAPCGSPLSRGRHVWAASRFSRSTARKRKPCFRRPRAETGPLDAWVGNDRVTKSAAPFTRESIPARSLRPAPPYAPRELPKRATRERPRVRRRCRRIRGTRPPCRPASAGNRPSASRPPSSYADAASRTSRA